jgi:uncharacterized protein YceH (UPF0502 family)
MQLELDPTEQRVIGSLLEKERTVPDTYPMTLNGLRTACNQSSGRDPILHLSDLDVTTALDRLRGAGLTRVLHPSHGARQPKYRQVLDEVLGLDPAERAVVTLLLLRGAQTPGELRSRSDRLHPFASLSEVEQTLSSLAQRAEPLVEELDRRPGQKEQRWIHRLGPVLDPHPDSVETPTARPTEAVLSDGADVRDDRVATAYTRVAAAYAKELLDELDRKPFDRWLLERLADLAEGGPVADVGCGPGQVTAHLALAGADATGFDLAPGMVGEARQRFPELRFEVADLRSLTAPPGGGGWSVITAWYALVHLASSELPGAIGALAGALRPGGALAVALHEGDDVRQATDWFGTGTDLAFTLHRRDAVVGAFEAAGLVDLEWYLRNPSSPTEAQTERIYVVGRRPGQAASGT